ncbi:MAG TPA: MFS transporter [Verrucomicrobiae bacterium]|nr:MFS transporter [Verrucomicrobiae bacterium]
MMLARPPAKMSRFKTCVTRTRHRHCLDSPRSVPRLRGCCLCLPGSGNADAMKKPSLLIIFLTVFIDLIGFGIVLPLLPRYAEKFGAEGFMIGVIIASFSVMQFFFAPAWGRLSDKIGRRPVLLISTAGSAVSYALFALAAAPRLSPHAALAVLLASRVFAGICGANISVASAYIADVTPPEKRSRGMGMIGMAFGLGFILGPVIGALSASGFGLAGPGWVASAICITNFLLAVMILAESRTPGTASAPTRPKLAQWAHALKMPRVGFLIGLYFLATFCFACFESTLPLLLASPGFHPDDFKNPTALAQKISAGTDPVSARLRSLMPAQALADLQQTSAPTALRRKLFDDVNALLLQPHLFDVAAWQQVNLRPETAKLTTANLRSDSLRHFNRLLLEDAYPAEIKRQKFYYDEKHIGYLFAFCGLMSAMVQGGMIGRLVKRFGEPKLISSSLVLVGLSLLIIPYAATLVVLLVGLAAVAMSSGLNRAPTMGLISIFTPQEEQGGILGVTQSAGTLGRIFGPLFATSAYALYPHSPYLAAAALCVIAGLIAAQKLRHARPVHTEATAA